MQYGKGRFMGKKTILYLSNRGKYYTVTREHMYSSLDSEKCQVIQDFFVTEVMH